MKQYKSALAGFFIAVLCPLTVSAAQLDLKRPDNSEITFHLNHHDQNVSDKLLVLIQGSDCNSVVHNALINEQFSQVLPGADVLTIEKYGITSQLPWDTTGERTDCPAAYMENDSLLQRTSDYLQVINQLKESNQYETIVLLGGSEGAVVANMIAARSAHISASISLNGGGRFFKDDVLANMKSAGMPEASYQQAKQGFTAFAQKVLAAGPFPVSQSLHGYKWWHAMLSTDQLSLMKSIETPALVIWGTADTNVDVAGATSLAKALKEGGKTNITFRSYEGMNHRFQQNDGTTMIPQIISDIKAWLEDEVTR